MAARDEAHRLWEEGFTVLPAHPRDKHPLVRWQQWQNEDPPETLVNEWLTSSRWDNCNFAIVTGKQIVVIDADSEEAEVWVKNNLPFTPRTVKTARGRHYYFKSTPGLEVRNAVNADAKIDIRGRGGIVIAPGSVHETGAVYTEEVTPGFDADWRELPALEQTDLERIYSFNNAGNLNFDPADLGVAEGGRNNEAAKKAGYLINQGYSVEETIDHLAYWNQHNTPRLTRKELVTTVNSIAQTHARNHPEQVVTEEQVEQVRGLLEPLPFEVGDFAAIPKRQWVYGRHYIRKFLSVTVAAGGTGKTALTLAEAMAMATGRDLLNVETERQRVWVWNLEDPLEELQRRLAAICVHYQIEPDEYAGHLFVNSGRDSQLVLAEQAGNQPILTPAVDVVTEFIQAYNIDVVIVDPFVSSHRLNENDNTGMDLVVKAWGRIAEQGHCAVELVHHVRKAQAGQAAAYGDARGASALTDAARHVRRLVKMTPDEAKLADIEESQAWRYTREADSKDNLAPPTSDSSWREMRSVDLPNGDNVGVVEPWDWPDPFSDVTAEDLEAVKRSLREQQCRTDVRSKTWFGHAVADVLELDVTEPAVKSKVRQLMAIWVENNQFEIYEEYEPKARKKFTYIRPLYPAEPAPF